MRLISIQCGALGLILVATPAAAEPWQEQEHPLVTGKNEILDDVLALSRSNVWAVGTRSGPIGGSYEFRTHILHWDGSTWALVPSPNVETAPAVNFLYGVDGRSANDIWAVGSILPPGQPSQSMIQHWNGTSWTIVPSPNPGSFSNSLEAVAVSRSPDDAWAVGFIYQYSPRRSWVLRWNGIAWLPVEVPVPSFCSESYYPYLTDVAAWSAQKALATGHCISTGGGSQGFVMRWNGTRWRQVAGPGQVPANSELHGVTFVSGTEAWAVGERHLSPSQYEPLLLHWDGAAWMTTTPPAAGTYPSLKSVTASGSANVWAVGVTDSPVPPFAGPLTMHWDGTQWTREPAPVDFGSLWGVDIFRSHAWAVGAQLGDEDGDSLILRRRN